MRMPRVTYRRCNYYSSSSLDNKPPTEEQIRANKMFFGIPFVIFCFFMILAFISFVIIPSVEAGTFFETVVILTIVFWVRHKIVMRYKFK